MILLQSQSKFLLQILQDRLLNPDKGVDLDCHSVEFDDVRYHILFSIRNPQVVVLSVVLPIPPPEAIFIEGLPFGAIEAIKTAYGAVVQILDPPKDGYNLTVKLNLSRLPPDEEQRQALLVKIASIREVVLGAPLRLVLKNLATKTVAPEMDQLLALVHRPKESFFLLPQAEKVTVVYPMRFQDPNDIVLATSFLQELVEARRAAALNYAPLCTWSLSPPELKGVPAEVLTANAGFVTFVILPRHVEGKKLDKTVWSLLTFHAYVSYHVKEEPTSEHKQLVQLVLERFTSPEWHGSPTQSDPEEEEDGEIIQTFGEQQKQRRSRKAQERFSPSPPKRNGKVTLCIKTWKSDNKDGLILCTPQDS